MQRRLQLFEPLALAGGEDFPTQALAAFGTQQSLQIDAQAAPVCGAGDQRGGLAVAVGDRADHAGGPARRAVLADGGDARLAGQGVQGVARAQASGQVFALALGGAGHAGDGATDEVAGLQLVGLEHRADQLRAGHGDG